MAIIGTKNVIDSSAETFCLSANASFPVANLALSFDKLFQSSTTGCTILTVFSNPSPVRVVFLNDHNATQTATYSGKAYGPSLFDYNGAGFTSGNFTITTTTGTASLDTTEITLSADWEGTITPKFNGFPYDATKTYAVFVSYTGTTAGWEGLGGEPETDIVTGGTVKRLVDGSHGIATKTGMNGVIDRFWVKEVVYTITDEKLLGPLEIFGARPWGVFPWGGIKPENEIIYLKNTSWLFDKARQITAIRLDIATDSTNPDGYFQMRNLHASYALEIGNDTGQTSPNYRTFPDRVELGLAGLGKTKNYERGVPNTTLAPRPRRTAEVPYEQVENIGYISTMADIQALPGGTYPIPYIHDPYTNDYGLRQAGMFYGLLSPGRASRLGAGIRWSGQTFSIEEVRL